MRVCPVCNRELTFWHFIDDWMPGIGRAYLPICDECRAVARNRPKTRRVRSQVRRLLHPGEYWSGSMSGDIGDASLPELVRRKLLK